MAKNAAKIPDHPQDRCQRGALNGVICDVTYDFKAPLS